MLLGFQGERIDGDLGLFADADGFVDAFKKAEALLAQV